MRAVVAAALLRDLRPLTQDLPPLTADGLRSLAAGQQLNDTAAGYGMTPLMADDAALSEPPRALLSRDRAASAKGLVVDGAPRSLLYVKTHKTGSSTLGAIFYRLAAARGLKVMKPDNCCDFNYPDRFPGRGGFEGNGRYDAILAHAVYNAAEMRPYLKNDPIVVTVLREPVAQFHSSIKYYQVPFSFHAHRQYMHDPGLRGDEVYDWAKWLGADMGLKGGHNQQSADLGWLEQGGTEAQVRHGMTAEECSSEKAQGWLDSIVEQLDVVVITEEYDAGLVLLSRALDLPIEALAYLRVDQHQGGCGPADCDRLKLPTGKDAEAVRASNCLDVQLYARLKERAEQRWAALQTADPTAQKDLDYLKALNSELRSACVNGSCRDWIKDGTIAFCESLEAGQLRGDPRGKNADSLCNLVNCA